MTNQMIELKFYLKIGLPHIHTYDIHSLGNY